MYDPVRDNIRTRPAQESDVPALLKATQMLGKQGTQDYFATCLQEQAAGRRAVLIAVQQDGVLAGYGMLNWMPLYPLYRKLGVPEIQDVNVVPERRRRGVATALIRHAEISARAQGCAHIGISVGLNADYGPAQRLYVKLGYMPDGHGVAYDRQTMAFGEVRPLDDNLCLMMIKSLT